MTKKLATKNTFSDALQVHKSGIDADVADFCQRTLSQVHERFGEYPVKPVEAYCAILGRGGKRIRGALTVAGYKLFGGQDEDVAYQAAQAIEMMHAYILMIDDIQDRSETRRGGPAAHIILKKEHKKAALKDDPQHFGESMAMNGALFGAHSAMNVLADLNSDADRRLAVIKNVNEHFLSTLHGQTLDIYNEVLETVDESDIDKVLLWKTAFYTFMNPLQLGAILAGASEKDLKMLEEYSLHAGRVFQITDDILGVFGEEDEAGKSPMDDIKEGKRTLLSVKAIELAEKEDAYFLQSMLGNKKLTQAEFQRCQDIISSCGALEYAQKQAKDSVIDALAALDRVGSDWDSEQVEFLKQLVQELLDRKS